jgi:hypothetical protein
MKPHICKRSHALSASRRPAHVVEAQRHAVSIQQCQHVIGIPARISKLQNMAETRRQCLQEVLQPATVQLPTRGN